MRAMPTPTIRVGFIGAGANSRLHHVPKMRAQPGVELMAVANRTRESGERIAKDFGIIRVHDDWREVVQATDIDAVCIGTWPSTHCEMTVAALEAGKHVLCEARMAMNAGQGRRMLAAARQRPHLITQLVPAPNSLEVDATLQSLLAQGYVGDVVAVELHSTQARFVDRDAPLHWRQDIELSGPNTLNMGIWYEALMRWLGPARRVMALTRVNVSRRRDAGGAWRAVNVPDHVDLLLTLGNDAPAHLRFSAVTGLAPTTEAWIFGSEGTLRLDADAKRVFGGRRGDTQLVEIPIPAAERVGWRAEEEFVNAIRGQEKVTRTTFEDGVRYMEFTDAVARSAAGGLAVDIPEL